MHRIVDRETPAAMASMLLDSMVDEHGRRLKIEMRKSDGFFNATLMCQSADKRWGNYNDSNIARTYQRRLADITGIPVESLVVSNPGRNGGTRRQARCLGAHCLVSGHRPPAMDLVFPADAGDFAGAKVRKTTETPPRVSVFDLIAVVKDESVDAARKSFSRLKETHPEFEAACHYFKFPGQGQRDTPVTGARGVVVILNLLGGPRAARFRLKCADIVVRALGGDETLVEEIRRNAESQAALPADAPMRLFGETVEAAGDARLVELPTALLAGVTAAMHNMIAQQAPALQQMIRRELADTLQPAVSEALSNTLKTAVSEVLDEMIKTRKMKAPQAPLPRHAEMAKELRGLVTRAVKDYRSNSRLSTPEIEEVLPMLKVPNMAVFIDHMESKFETNMTWENWGPGKYNWHFGHVLPLIKFDLDDPGERAEAMAMKNYKPQWGQENLAQGDRLPDGSLGRNKRKRPAANGGEVGAQQRGRSLLELGKPVEWYMGGVQEWLMAYMSKNGGPEPSWQSELVGCTVKAFANTIQKKVGMRLWSELDKTWILDVDRVVGTDTSKYLELTDAFRHARWMAFNKAPPRPEPSPEPTMNPALCFLDH